MINISTVYHFKLFEIKHCSKGSTFSLMHVNKDLEYKFTSERERSIV